MLTISHRWVWTGTELTELTHWFLAFHQFLRDFCRHFARQIDPDPNVILEGLRHTPTRTNTSTSDFMVECGNFGWGADWDYFLGIHAGMYIDLSWFIQIPSNSITQIIWIISVKMKYFDFSLRLAMFRLFIESLTVAWACHYNSEATGQRSWGSVCRWRWCVVAVAMPWWYVFILKDMDFGSGPWYGSWRLPEEIEWIDDFCLNCLNGIGW